MTWRPLITEDRRAALAAVVRDIVVGVDDTPATGVGDHVDRALLHAYAARHDVVPDRDDRCSAALAAAVATLTQTRATPALIGGAAGVGWCVAHLADADTQALVCRRIDEVLLRLLGDWQGSYDLINGLVGFGVYALARGESGHVLAARVVEQLARTAHPQRAGLAWHTPASALPPPQREQAPAGYWNLGLAHGIPGIIALLARYLVAGIESARTRELLDGAVAFVLAAEPARDDGRFPSWLAGSPGEPVGESAHHRARTRLAWCYNDLGVSLALTSAGFATGNSAWLDEALALAHACALRDTDDARIEDAALCHGAIGAAHLFNRLGQATGEEIFIAAADHWLDHALDLRDDRPIAGFPTLASRDDKLWLPDASLVGGATGIALALHSMITDVEPAWDRLLLVDLPTT